MKSRWMKWRELRFEESLGKCSKNGLVPANRTQTEVAFSSRDFIAETGTRENRVVVLISLSVDWIWRRSSTFDGR